MVMIAVKVPAGAVPGDKVDAVYDGRRVWFVVPPSVRPGNARARAGVGQQEGLARATGAVAESQGHVVAQAQDAVAHYALVFASSALHEEDAAGLAGAPVERRARGVRFSVPGEAPDDITASADPPPRPPPRRDENGARAFAGAPRQSPPAAVAAAMPYADVEGESADFCGWLEPIRASPHLRVRRRAAVRVRVRRVALPRSPTRHWRRAYASRHLVAFYRPWPDYI